MHREYIVKTSDKCSTDIDSQPALFMRLNRLCRSLVVLFLVFSAFEPQKPLYAAFAESTGSNRIAHKCKIEVAQFEPGDAGLTPSFSATIRENLVNELTRAKRFNQVFRQNDHQTPAVDDLLILKTKVQKYTPGANTRPTVPTLTARAAIDVRVQLSTRANHLVLDQLVTSKMWLGDKNLRGTRRLVRNIAATLKESMPPEPTDLGSNRETSEARSAS